MKQHQGLLFLSIKSVMGGLNREGRCDKVIAIQNPGKNIVLYLCLRYGMSESGNR